MRVNLLGAVAAVDGDRALSGAQLGGRRARIVLAALALADGPVPAEVLAAAIWRDAPPVTWPVALRGTIRTLRIALEQVGGGGQQVVATAPAGYCLAPGVEVDVRLADAAVRRCTALAGEGRHRAALEVIEPFAAVRGGQLLAGEDADWLAPHRAAVDLVASQALALTAAAASAVGEHPRAVAAARSAIASFPLDERAHRALIRALDRAGDRAGALQAYERCRATLADELGVDPSADTVAAYLTAAGGPSGPRTARLPASATSFLGRAREVRELAAAVDRPGIVSVVGAGGVGKSRLAAVVAGRAELPGGRYWVPLGTVADDALVAGTVALELEARGSDATTALVEHLAPLGRALLVLDGADQVVDGTATLAATLVEACPMLTVLVTSRAALHLHGERTTVLEPLPAPDTDDPVNVADNPVARLLLDRVRAAGGELEIDDATSGIVAALCRRCAGLPLAVELAAAQLGDMPIGDLLDQLEAADGDRLRSIAANSYALLSADEAAAFRRLAVLDGPVGLPFVRAVVAGADVAPQRVVRILRELGARGLVLVDRSGPRWRYSQDDDVHRYAGELLREHGEEPATYARLLDAVRALLPDDAREPPAPFAADVTAVLGSVRSLLGAGIAGRADRDRCLEVAFRLHRYWAATSVAEGRFWLARLLANAGDSPWRRYATYALGYLGYWAGDTGDALRHLQAAIELFAGEPDPFVARAYIYVAGLLDDLDRPVDALDYVRRSIAAAEPFGTDLYVAAAMGLGSVLSERGDPAAARYAADAVARCRVDGSAEQLAALLPTAAMVCWQVGALADARDYVAEARPMHADHRRIARVVLLSVTAGLALADGDLDAAVDHGRAADDEGTELGVEREMPLIRAVLARALLDQGRLVDAADRALAGVETAAAMTVGFPLAIGLETAALVGVAAGARPVDVSVLLGTAAALRAAGDRPPPVTLRELPAHLPGGLSGGLSDGMSDGMAPAARSRDDAVAVARRVLAAVH